MRYTVLLALILVTACISQTPQPDKAFSNEKPIVFRANSGQEADAFEGWFTVPENRANPDSRTLTLRYVRFAATSKKPGNPIVYLAGGPGGSGILTAKYRRLPLFLELREFGDVIALDQRGTGASNDMPMCTSSVVPDPIADLSDAQNKKNNQTALLECLSFWKDENIDLHGYTTVENVADLEDLRIHLHAKKLTLLGISYGSHLALAAIKQMGDRLDRVMIASAEGLDQTIKQPARTDAYFKRLQAAINAGQTAETEPLDIISLIKRVHQRLDENPLLISIPQKNGKPVSYLLHRRDMQQIASAMISDPWKAFSLVQIYEQLDQGNSEPAAQLLQRWYVPDQGISFRPMSVMMDIASGIGSERRKMIERQAKTSILGEHLNTTLDFVDVASAYDLGDPFRAKPVSDLPLLLLSGNLDGRTYLRSQQEAVSGLSNAQKVTVTNAGHNLFMVTDKEVRPGILSVMQDFMRSENVDGREIIVELPPFSH
jgi:pimeloyl-ACP methyl ester carboxylesterase